MLDRLPSTPAPLLRVLAVLSVIGQGGIAVTGSVVRVTGSGLGCPTWPQCFPGSLVPEPHPEIATLTQWVEFGNRLLTVALVVVSGAVLLAALARRPRTRRLVWLAAAMPLGVVAQAVLGGITVLTGLAWWTVALHFLVSMPLVWLAVLLVRESSPAALAAPPSSPRRVLVARPVRGLIAVTAAVLAVLAALGTLVTAAGPHAGDATTPRLGRWDTEQLSMAHAHVLFAFLGLLVGLGFLLHATGAPHPVLVRFRVLVGVTLAQGALGGLQYSLGVPEALVAFHVLGAVLTVVATAALWAATGAPATGATPAPRAVTTPAVVVQA